jgi:hypothetical protein
VIVSSIVMRLQSIVTREILPSVVAVVTAGSLCAAAGVEEAPLIESIGSFPRLVNEAAGLERTVAAFRAGLGDAFVNEVPAITIREDFGEFGTAADVLSFF